MSKAIEVSAIGTREPGFDEALDRFQKTETETGEALRSRIAELERRAALAESTLEGIRAGTGLDDDAYFFDFDGPDGAIEARRELTMALTTLIPYGAEDARRKAEAVRSAAMKLLRIGTHGGDRQSLVELLKVADRWAGELSKCGLDGDVLRLLCAAVGPCDQTRIWAMEVGLNLAKELIAEVARLQAGD